MLLNNFFAETWKPGQIVAVIQKLACAQHAVLWRMRTTLQSYAELRGSELAGNGVPLPMPELADTLLPRLPDTRAPWHLRVT